MITRELIKIKVVNGRSLGKLSGVEIFLTHDLASKLKSTKARGGGSENLLGLFKRGMALRGFKHLVETIKETYPNSVIVFTHEGKSTKDASQYVISYDHYRKTASGRFFALYRETGKDIASKFLNSQFPLDFQYDDPEILDTSQLKKLNRQFPEIVKNLSSSKANQKVILGEASSIVDKLKEQGKISTDEVNAVKDVQRTSNIFALEQTINELKRRLEKRYSETRGKNSWQRWIYANNWMLGANYQKPIEQQKINLAGSMPDYLFPTIDGFLDILEIKLPNHEVVKEDASHTGSFMWSSEANKAIGQVVNYLNYIELNQLQLKELILDKYKLDLSVIKPRAFILIGNSGGWSKKQRESLRKLNYSLHGVEVLTYYDLLQRASMLVSMYHAGIGLSGNL